MLNRNIIVLLREMRTTFIATESISLLPVVISPEDISIVANTSALLKIVFNIIAVHMEFNS